MTRPDAPARPRSNVASPSRRRWLAIGLIVLGLGVAASSLLGPAWFAVIDYHASDGALRQVVGGDFAALFLVAPVSVLAGILTLRGHPAGPVIATGPAVFAVYTYAQLALGADFIRYPGNSEQFFLFDLGLFVLGGMVAIVAWNTIDADRIPEASPRFDRVIGVILLAAAAFLLIGLHLPQLLEVWRRELTEAYLADPGVFWLVKLMDLGIVVPAMVGVGIGLLRHRAWARKAQYAVVGWFALLGSSVAGMAVVMRSAGDPEATWFNTIGFVVFAVLGLALAVALYRPLFRRTAGADADRGHVQR